MNRYIHLSETASFDGVRLNPKYSRGLLMTVFR